MQLLDMFSGGAFGQASIFALGIMPYITASIVIQLMGMVVPSFQKMQREGESGRMKLNQYTRYLTVAILLVQAPAYLMNLQYQVNAAGGHAHISGLTMIYLSIVLTAGAMLIMWLGEKITDKGIGNGISLIILVGILARFPGAIVQEFTGRLNTAQGGLVMFLVEIVILFAVTAGAVMLTQGTRKVPVQYAKRIVGNKQYGGARQYIPLKVNAANVMPIIFAQALMFIPITLAGFGARQDASGLGGWISRNFGDMNSLWYNVIYFLMIVAFTYFYTAITVRPTQMAEEMKKNSGFIPGIKPGKKTAEYLDSIMSRITLPGSLFLGIVAILPAFARFFGVNQQFAQFFGGTSLLITVGVVLDTLQQIETHLMMHHYDGLMKSGKIKGRTR
jgi:preprotein translocase subunit SecY